MKDFWFYYSFVLPALIGIVALVVMRMHERDIDRKIKSRQAERNHPGE